jgi:hypothetical protein
MIMVTRARVKSQTLPPPPPRRRSRDSIVHAYARRTIAEDHLMLLSAAGY